MLTVTNGCDYKFYVPKSLDHHLSPLNEDIVFYQGNIFDKLDYELLIELAKRMPTWQFVFCGKVIFNEDPGKNYVNFPMLSMWDCSNQRKLENRPINPP